MLSVATVSGKKSAQLIQTDVGRPEHSTQLLLGGGKCSVRLLLVPSVWSRSRDFCFPSVLALHQKNPDFISTTQG
jgi:hypothetical protein